MPIAATPQTRLGRWLLDRFAERGWESYRQAATYLGISHTQLRGYVQGVTPSPSVLTRLAEKFGATRADLDALIGPEQPLGASAGYVVQTPAATVRIDDPRAVGFFFGFLRRFARMTEEEKDSLVADEVDIPERPVAERGGEDAPIDPARPGRSA